ncbi:hypothetical protein [Streptomyces resistomycificus]|uniref:Uncharacterized protein n=1 Tax=Streptomyces resistomycificus TaxID=67356 RepID=A0A0L8LXM6_9ACTN|nr:hypothetical protein [Streptomyces resistomycificus]KOG42896.1 hypothetical protein ADK37_02780 [Streptomyces resistomycificus]KUO01481.1 hypothetical protein AQJ84_03295 [Streptomyces resistomycificus]
MRRDDRYAGTVTGDVAPPRPCPPGVERGGATPAHGYDTTVDGTVEVPDVGAPMSLTTCSYRPLR